MENKYYRLITFVVDICPKPLRELFMSKAKADLHFKSFDTYLAYRKKNIDKLHQRHAISNDQYTLIFPSIGFVDVQAWNVTLLAVLLQELFCDQLQETENNCIQAIQDTIKDLKKIASPELINDEYFDNTWIVLSNAVTTLLQCAGSPLHRIVANEIKAAFTENMPNIGHVLCKWFNDTCVQLQLHNTILDDKLDRQADVIDSLKEESIESNTILTKASVKRKGRSGIPEKRMKIFDNKIERMRETIGRSLREDNDSLTTNKEDVGDITEQLNNNHRVIVTGFDKQKLYKCALAAIKEMKYERPDQCLQIDNPSDWKRVGSEDARVVLFREPFGRSMYDVHKVEVMLEEFDKMLNAADEENDNVIDIIIVTNQTLLKEVTRKHEHDMLSPTSTVYIDSTADTDAGELCSSEDTVHENIIEQSHIYKQTYKNKRVDQKIKEAAEILFMEHNTVVIVGKAGSGKTSLSLQLLPSYDLSNGEENFMMLYNPDELKFVKFRLKPVLIIKLLPGGKFDLGEARKWYGRFDVLFGAVCKSKVAVISIIDADVFRMWQATMPSHPLLEHVVYTDGSPMKKEQQPYHGNHTQLKAIKKAPIHYVTDVEDVTTSCEFETATYCQKEEVNATTEIGNHTQLKAIKIERIHYDVEDVTINCEFETATSCQKEEVNATTEKDVINCTWGTVHSVNDARRLMQTCILPDQQTLEDMILRLGRKSDLIQFVCDSVCDKIAEESPNIEHVFAAYNRENEKDLHFVVFSENEICFDLQLGYKCYLRNCNNVVKTEDTYSSPEYIGVLSSEEVVPLKKMINETSSYYMTKHKYLSAISARKVVCENRQDFFIIMYVHPCTDKYTSIPLKEDPLPEKFEDLNIIVRHGIFKTCVGGADELQHKISMGCKITSSSSKSVGTLGGFVDHPVYGLCGFTCAHVVFNTTQIKDLKKSRRKLYSRENHPCFIYQPDKCTSSEPIGRVVEAAYTENASDSYPVGVDLALMQIEKRHPDSGLFPSCRSNEILNYKSGRIWGQTRITESSCNVQKFGISTGCTHGKIVFTGMAVKKIDFVTKTLIEVDTILYNQLEIVNENEDVCKQGDSGGLVFMKDHENELVCVGMVIGVICKEKEKLHGVIGKEKEKLHGVVTPVEAILNEWGLRKLKAFTNEIAVVEEKLTKRIDKISSDMTGMKTSLTSIEGKLDQLIP